MCLDKWIMTALSTQILQVIEEEKVDKLGRYEHIPIVIGRIFQQLLLKEINMTDSEKKDTVLCMCHVWRKLGRRIYSIYTYFLFSILSFKTSLFRHKNGM